MDERVEVIEQMWAAYRRGQLPAILDYATEDAEWRPHSAGGRTFSSTAEYRAFIEEMAERGEVVEATLVSVEPAEDYVLVHGRLRVRRSGALEDTPMHWLHRFRDGRIVFTASAPRREDVLAMAGEAVGR